MTFITLITHFLFQIEKYCIHILSTRDEENNLLADRLSAEELQYAQKYLDLVQKHFETSLLDHIPETLRAMDAKNDNENMGKSSRDHDHDQCDGEGWQWR